VAWSKPTRKTRTSGSIPTIYMWASASPVERMSSTRRRSTHLPASSILSHNWFAASALPRTPAAFRSCAGMPYVRAWADNSRQSLLRLTTSAAPSTPALLFVVPSFVRPSAPSIGIVSGKRFLKHSYPRSRTPRPPLFAGRDASKCPNPQGCRAPAFREACLMVRGA
jgi:hypothetical protein